jgi:Glycoside Hydrolase Family 113
MGRLAATLSLFAGAVGVAWIASAGCGAASAQQRLDGFNVIATPGYAYGSASARRALARAKRLGATTVAIVPFLWQARPADPHIRRGQDISDGALRTAIRDVRKLGLTVVVKPHVWVPQSWAGAVAPRSEADWHTWFAGYRSAVTRIATIAAQEKADVLAVGTELAKTTQRAEWFDLIAAIRAYFPGTLTYLAHNAEEAEAVPFWPQLDVVGVTLYPSLGRARDRTGRMAVMRSIVKRLDSLAARTGKQIIVGEVGLRSAVGATIKPWESPEERRAAPDPLLQAEVLADWLSVLRRPSVRGVLIWRWFTDPAAGGPADTDFTVQGKPAEGVLLCAWSGGCPRPKSESVPGADL